MAKAYATCATPDCTNHIVFVESNRKNAARKAEWAESQGFVCSDCQAKERALENAKAAEANQAKGLPALTGTEKQIAWAEKIRADKLAIIEKAQSGELTGMMLDAYWGSAHNAIALDDEHLPYAIAQLTDQCAASWFIDNRDTKIGVILKSLFVKNPPAIGTAIDAEIINDIKDDATVRPESALSETIAEIAILDKTITVKFPEKREDFRLLMRRNGFEWLSSAWRRSISPFNGTLPDRVAEIGNELLAHGFIIRIYDEAIRQKAISADFEAEQTRWIKAYTSGSEQGKVCITWSRDEDYYKSAKRLPTAKYVKPHISVDPAHYEQIMDFAEVNGFSVTEAAQALLDAARIAKESALVVAITPKPKVRKKALKKPEAMPVPESVEVDNDLLD